jgi:hypothetical protein
MVWQIGKLENANGLLQHSNPGFSLSRWQSNIVWKDSASSACVHECASVPQLSVLDETAHKQRIGTRPFVLS